MLRIGIDMGGTKIEGIGLGADGRTVARERIPTPRNDYDGTVRAIASLVARLEADAGETGTVGVGIPGCISPRTGLVKNANSTWLIGHAFDRDLAAALDRPVRLENDANCLAVSESVDGAAAGARVVFAAILGTGCGGGIVVENRPISGANAIAGEWGHTPLPWPRAEEWPGRRCYCGQVGCLETWISGTGLAADHLASCGETLTGEEIAVRAEAGEAKAERSLAAFEDRLARGLTVILNILDPDVIVLGGGVSRISRLYETVPRLIPRYAFSDQIDTPLRPAKHGDASGVRGAAWLWPLVPF